VAPAPIAIPIRCSCGALTGQVERTPGDDGRRLVCYCDDCQAFARFLGRADEILDEHGGSDIFQTAPARVTLTGGEQHLACMRLGPKGLLRFYASCCRTPIGNMLPNPQFPFVGLVLLFALPFVAEAWRSDEISPSPGGLPLRWLIKAALPAGFALLALAALARLLRVGALLFATPQRRDPRAGDA